MNLLGGGILAPNLRRVVGNSSSIAALEPKPLITDRRKLLFTVPGGPDDNHDTGSILIKSLGKADCRL